MTSFATSCRLVRRVNGAHSADSLHARPSGGGNAVELPVKMRTCVSIICNFVPI
jgi:hypothetical protein